jgi:molecular chaperone DnaK (HSP70)
MKDIGIDLGTTFSVIAVAGKVSLAEEYPGGEGIYLEECDVTVIPSPYGEATFPSALIQDPDNPAEFLFGIDALQKGEEGFAPVMFSKRKIGTREDIPLHAGTMVAKDVACEFLKYLKSCAEQALGHRVVRAVITHPAYFDRGAVEETREAAGDAGFDMSLPEQMLMEPLAAALSYARTDKRDPLRILTYDLGGGTFDVTYLERREGVIDMRAFDGNHLLGGYNFDRELAHWIRRRLSERGRHIVLDENNPDDRGRLNRLLRLAESVKIKLSNARTDSEMIEIRARDILVDTDGKPVQINERISREQYVSLIRSHLEEAAQCCTRALKKANVTPDDVHEVLLVGGSTYGPWVAESLKTVFRNATPRLFNPDMCVGTGAAIHARMVLPPLVESEQFRIILDVPETCVLDILNVAGQVLSIDGKKSLVDLRASLRLLSGSQPNSVSLDKNGRFIFQNIELIEEGANQFTLKITGPDGSTILEHSFTIHYSPESSETSAVRTVLPRPLFIETVDGMIPLVEEGASLPAKCNRSFRRVNDNTNITLRLYQEQDPIGEVRIEEIPPEGGRGSFVDLEVEVTEKNQIRGTAVIRTTGNKVVTRKDIRVRFEMPEIGSADDLRRLFDDLKKRFLAMLLVNRDFSNELRAKGMSLIKEIEYVFEQQPLERQEVHLALRHLNRLLDPPKDEMSPSRREFESIIRSCRNAIADRQRKMEMMKNKAEDREAKTFDEKLATEAKDELPRILYLSKNLDKLEKEGYAAYERKDRLVWARIHDALADLEIQLRDRPKVDEMPTLIHKLLACRQIDRMQRQLQSKAQEIDRVGKMNDWRHEIERIRKGLKSAMTTIQTIDDDLESDQGLGQIRMVFTRSVGLLQEAIENLGGDIGGLHV